MDPSERRKTICNRDVLSAQWRFGASEDWRPRKPLSKCSQEGPQMPDVHSIAFIPQFSLIKSSTFTFQCGIRRTHAGEVRL
jgi:hypothetical protein